MNEFQNSLLETMQMFSKNASINATNSPIIQGEIVSVIDAGLKTYMIKYQENEFPAMTTGNIKYSIGEFVYVLVPNGDFSNDKIILGSTSPSASSLIQSGDSLKYYDISENLFDKKKVVYELNSHKTEIYTIELDRMQSEVLEEYLKRYKTLAFGYQVVTELAETQVGGNYGMRVNIPVLDSDGNSSVKTFTLDIDQLLGTPYSMGEWSPQSIFFTLEDKYNIDTKRIITIDYFCSDFPQDENIDIKDIFFKDVFFKVVEEYTEEDNIGYKLTLTSDSGNYFLRNGSTVKTISPILRVNGEITNFTNRPCYWFIEDSSVVPGHEKYLNHGGRGWRLLQEGGDKFELDISLVLCEAQFKCVILYDDYVISDVIYIKNLNTGIEIDVFPTRGSATFIKGAGEVDLTATYYEHGFSDDIDNATSVIYHWQRYDKNHNLISTTETYSSIEGSRFISNLKFGANSVEDFNIIKCEITKDGKLIGSKELTISVTDNWQYKLVIENGNKIYKYDSDGDSPMEANYDGPVSSVITGILPLKYRVFKVDGTELTEEEYLQCKYTWYIPVNSMFEIEDKYKEKITEDGEYYFVDGRGISTLSYKIAKRFDKSKAENNIRLQVDFLGNLLDNIINISFLKEGASGTNGTKYAAVAVMEDEDGNKYPYGARGGKFGYVQKMHIVYNTALGTWYWHDTRDNTLKDFDNRLNIGVLVYEDGELLNYGDNGYTVSYSIFDSRVTNPCFVVSTAGNKANFDINPDTEKLALNGTYCNIIQAKVTITKSGNQSAAAATTVLYAYYPIELTITNIASYNNMKVLPTLNGGFSEVLYATDGTNPQYDSTYPFSCSESVLEDEIKEYYSITWDAQHHLHEYDVDPVEKAHGTLKYKPSQKYDDGNSKNYVKATLAFDGALKTKLTQQISDNTANYNSLDSAIKNINEIKNSVVKAETLYLNYNFENIIQSISSLLKVRKQAYEQTFVISQYVGLLEQYILEFHPEVLDNCAELKDDLYGDNSRKGLIQALEDAQGALINFVSKKSIIKLSQYEIDFRALENSYCLYELNRGVATTLDAYIADINQAISVYMEYYNNIQNLTDNLFVQYKNITYHLQAVNNEIDSVVNIKNIIQNNYINVLPNIFDEKELLNKVKGVYSEQILPYLTTDGSEQQVKDWQKQQADLIAENERLNKILATEGKVMSHIRPIVLTFNRYEMSNINEWDGNKLYIDEENGEYLLAPQVGAGYKDANNRFTGMVMGLRNITSDNENATQTGLFGYHKGQQSVFLNAKNGSAIFGKAGNGGQIIVDPNANSAMLYSSNYWDKYDGLTGLPSNYTATNENGKGMLIDLSTPSIKWGNGKFSVDKDGNMHVAGAGSETAGDVGGWKIYSDSLQSANNKIILNSSENGYIKLADKNGKIYSGSHDSLSKRVDGFYLSHDGLSIGSGIEISSAGIVKIGKVSGAKYWTISGNNDNSYISYGTAGASGGVYLGTNALKLGTKFNVDNEGNLTAKYLTANVGGSIGGWTIGSSTLSAKNITLNSNGSMSGKVTSDGDFAWEISTNGTATFNKLIANNKGSIGGWEIGTSTLKGGAITLDKDGEIYCKIGSTKKWSLKNDGSATIGNFKIADDGSITAEGGNFNSITVDGNSTFKGTLSGASGDFTGEVKATKGTFTSGTFNSCTISSSCQINCAISGDLITTGTIQAARIKVGDMVFGAGQVTSGTFDTARIPNLDANKITTGTLSADRIGAGSITSGKIASNAITSGKIAAGAITADKIDVDNLQSLSSSIGGWSIDSNGIYKSVNSSYGSYEVRISSQFAGSPNNIPCISAGGNFKIFATGSVQCSSCECGYLSLDGTSLTKTQLNKLLELID